MNKTWIFILTMIFSNCAFANAQYEYDSGTAEGIKSIYWLSQNEDSAIVYARFEGFYSLRELIDQTILAGNITTEIDLNLDGAEKLLLMMPEQETILEILLTDNHLIFKGQIYQLDSAAITKIKTMNGYRIKKGDLISPNSLVLAMERFGFHR